VQKLAFYNTLIKEREKVKGREDEKEDVSSYSMPLGKTEGTAIQKTKH
jgi:hypothetical protein